MTQDMIATPHSDQRSENNKIMTRFAVTLLLMMTVGVGEMWGQTTYTYYALHANGKGYMKQRHAAVANDGTFRYENVYDGNGYSIWVYSSDGYLTNDMYYLCEANGTLILSDKPSTKWELVADDGKTRLRKQGTTKIVGLNSRGTPVLDEPENLANKYAVCEMTVVENNSKWEGPKDVSYTVRSPQLVTFMRVYYLHNITATILKNDAGKTDQKVVDKQDSRVFQRLTFKSTTDTNRGTSWDIDETNAVIYNKQESGDVSVKATYTLTSCDPIAASNHSAVDADVTLKIQPAALTPKPAKSYLLFYTKEANYRFPYDTNEMSGDDAVNPQGKKDVLTDPDISLNGQISWKVEADAAGFVSFKNVETGRYLYYDANDFTHDTNYGVIKVGSTSLPNGDNRYKFRLYQPKNHDTYGACQTIIPYDLQFVVGRSEGDNGIINDGICCAWNVYKDQKVISLWKGNGDSKWKIYAYEAENRLTSDWTINGPNAASETGTYNFKATAYYSRNIVGSPTKNTDDKNNRDLEIAKTYTKLPVKYQWTVSGTNSYISTVDNSSNGDGKLAVTVNSMPVSNTLGTVECEAYVDVGSYTLIVDKVEREFSVTKKLSNKKSVAFNLYPLSIVPTSFTEISSLSQITNAAGFYKLSADCSDNVPTDIAEFTGWLDGDNHIISGLSAPLFAKMSGGAVVRNLTLKDVSISSSGKVGAIASEADGNARIYNIGILSGSVGSTDDYCGGLVGLLDGSARVINCFSYANITSGTTVGGIVGYNNYASTSVNIMTMVMNCMFYGNITGGTSVYPIYGGQIISNAGDKGINNYNYFSAEDLTATIGSSNYNCALGAEKRFLTRFEFYRQILNSTREQAAWYVTGSTDNAHAIMAKWVLDKSIAPYPILKPQDTYPSIVNIDAKNATSKTERNKGGLLGTLTVNIATSKATDGGLDWPSDASVNTTSLTLNRTDKDEDNYNFNYDKVQLPYYNEVGSGNYTDNKVVTGWKITHINGSTEGSGTFTTGKDVSTDSEGQIVTPYNFADRKCTKKDLYAVTKRIYNQGAYFDVPDGVTSITIEPYWGKASYLSDEYYDKVYNTDYTAYDMKLMGQRYANKTNYTINGSLQMVYTNMGDAINGLSRQSGKTVYDYAVVLVGNYNHYYGANSIKNDALPFTIMSADLDNDNEPDYTFFYQHQNRLNVSPIRFDFLCWPGIGMGHKPTGSLRMPDQGIFNHNGWFEVTNTCQLHIYQIEYNNNGATAPFIMHGGVVEQIVSNNTNTAPNNTQYIHLGGNVWFKMFNNGCHADKTHFTPHVPISVTGGDYDEFYLTGMFKPTANADADNAECYVSGGRFGEVAGAGQEQVKGDVYWQIDYADITNFYGGGINAAKPITGNITTNIRRSHVTTFCGGPKFGDMTSGKTVNTNAEGCVFGRFFGAGYGGTSFNRVRTQNLTNAANYNFNGWINSDYKRQYNSGNSGIATNFEYELFPYSGFSNDNNVGRFYVNYASLSLASCNDVTSVLTGCTISDNFYGGGNLGKVSGSITSTLADCIVHGNVFGAGFSATPPTCDVYPLSTRYAKHTTTTNTPYWDGNAGVYFPGVLTEAPVTYTWKQATSVSAGNEFEDSGDNHFILTTVDMSGLGTVTGNVTLNIAGTTTVAGDVYGGGALASSNTDYYKDVSPVATITTTVNLTGGVIERNVYGGGMGRIENGDEKAVEAKVGNTLVNLNGTKTITKDDNGQDVVSYNDNCVVKGCIFGCNNLNGSPQGNATVHVYKTQGYDGHMRTTGTDNQGNPKIESIDDTQHSYELAAVYGGGNLAAYEPTTPTTKKSYVIIDGCDLTSIKQVYGGGNAASTPATQVDINGTYEIEEVFGGGNGKDDISYDGTTKIDNPGANVGYINYSTYNPETGKWVDNTDADTKEKRQTTGSRYLYGTGEANVNIHGGLIHRVYGGSNTKGNVRQTAVTMLEDQESCHFIVDEAYGGGKSAPMDAKAQLLMSCIPGLKAAYGGAEAANIDGDVVLNITNGNFDRVFGGNNVSGTINGTITVNIEETGCHPVIIGQLYGGGNQAPYTAPFKKDSEGNDTDEREDGPTVNVKAFTSIGDVYGGGYGETAKVVGDTHVNINVCEGDKTWATTDTNHWDETAEGVISKTGDKTYTITEFERTTEVSDDNPDGFVYKEDSEGNLVRKTKNVNISVTLPFTSGQRIGAVNNVFGGGNAAKVDGNTYVNIGTKSTETFESDSQSRDVKGADIRGNVYGGGNEAEVTGNTNVQIGKKAE